ncbi:MAG: tryptophan synthase subunit alpha [Halobacteriota archaeon]
MTGIAATFRELKRRSEGGLIVYVMAGDPTPKHTLKIVDALAAGGADIVELGIPFSDPIADGPTLQRAAGRALEAGTTPRKVFDLACAITNSHEVPVAVMTYYNIVHQMGVEAFCSVAEQSGVSGVIAPDLPIEEASLYKEAATRHGIDTIFLAAPSTSTVRLEKLVTASSGFVYLVSANGITGVQKILQDDSISSIQRTASIIRGRAPLAVGFGLSLPSHVRQVIDNGASAAVVGSRFAQIVEQHLDDGHGMLKGLRECAQSLKGSMLPNKR